MIGQPEEWNEKTGLAPLQTPGAEAAIKTVEMHAGIALEAIHREVPGDLEVHASIYGSAIAATRDLLGEVYRLEADERFTPAGKKDALEATARKSLEVVAGHEKSADFLEAKVAESDAGLEKAGRIAKPAEFSDAEWDRTLDALRKQIEGLEPLERAELYSVAIDRGDAAALAAIESASPILDRKTKNFVPAIDPAVVKEKRIARARKAHPEIASARDRNGKLANSYRHAANLLRSEVTKRLPELDARQIEVLK